MYGLDGKGYTSKKDKVLKVPTMNAFLKVVSLSVVDTLVH